MATNSLLPKAKATSYLEAFSGELLASIHSNLISKQRDETAEQEEEAAAALATAPGCTLILLG